MLVHFFSVPRATNCAQRLAQPEKTPVPAEVADARLQELQALITAQQHAAQAAMVGREVQVLYEKPGRKPGQMVGKSDHLHAVHVEDPEGRIGQLQRVRVTGSSTNSLAAEPVGPVA